MKGFIYETLNAIDKEKMQVKEHDGYMTLTGVFGVCGVRNNNQRVYGLSNYKKMVDEMNERMKSESILGELEHPNTMNITLENVSHKIESIEIDENTGEVRGTIKLLNTPKGKIAQEIVKGGCELFISSRAMGDVDAQGNVTLEMLKTYDLVGTPGFSQARLKLNESLLCESMLFVESKASEDDADELISKKNEESENNLNNEMTENQNEKIATLESQVESLSKMVEDLSNQLVESKNEIAKTEGKLKDEMLTWFNESVSDNIQGWCVNELGQEIKENVMKEFAPIVENWIINQYSPEVQNWIVEQYSQSVQNWMFESFAPAIEKWVINEYSPVVEKWISTEYSDNLQKWMCEEFGGSIEKWITDEYGKSLKDEILENAPKKNLENTLSAVDEMLKVLENNDNSGKKKVFESAVVTEQSNEPMFIQKMPETARVKWNMATPQVKDTIIRKARIYNFTNESAIEQFWNEQDFTAISTINENQQNLAQYQDPWERNMRAALRKRF